MRESPGKGQWRGGAPVATSVGSATPLLPVRDGQSQWDHWISSLFCGYQGRISTRAAAMDHRRFVSSMPAGVKAGLTQRSTMPGLLHLAGHLGAIALTGALIAVQIPGWPALLPLHGVLLIFLFALEHEATHQTPFAQNRLNDAIGFLCGVVLLLPFEWFRYFHLAHHRHTNIPGKDPELLSGAAPTTPGAYLIHITGLPYWAGMARQLAISARGRDHADFLPASARPRVTRQARLMILLYLMLGASLLFSPLLIWLWIVPVLLGQPVLRLYLLAEHGRCAHVADMFANTRTTFTTRLVRFLAWNMPYHVEHHALPGVPFHKLPELHRLTRAYLKETEQGYVRFHQGYIAGLRSAGRGAKTTL